MLQTSTQITGYEENKERTASLPFFQSPDPGYNLN